MFLQFNLQLLKHELNLQHKLCSGQESKEKLLPFHLLHRCKANIHILSFHLATCNYVIAIFTYDKSEHY